MADQPEPKLLQTLKARFGDIDTIPDALEHNETLSIMAARGSCRTFQDRPISEGLLHALGAVALASPSKSDLQQRDIVFLSSASSRHKLSKLVAGQAWVADAPMIAIFCGNNRRQRLLHQWHDVPFANDHLDAFFNASVDAAIALGAFVTAAEAAGLGCCPISAVRNEAEAVSGLLGLPDHVFPIAGLAIGYPSVEPTISKRLPLSTTLHHNAYSETDLRARVERYDEAREASQPYAQHRYSDDFGSPSRYGWSQDKVRQYSREERQAFGNFVRSKGFRLV